VDDKEPVSWIASLVVLLSMEAKIKRTRNTEKICLAYVPRRIRRWVVDRV
jgi:hypothetical protein